MPFADASVAAPLLAAVAEPYPWWLWPSIAVVGMSLSILLYPLSIFIARRTNLIDRPTERKDHGVPVPYAGGLQVALAFFLGVVLLIWIPLQAPEWYGGMLASYPEVLDDLREHMNILVATFAGSLAIFTLGILDDRFELGGRVKLTLQAAAALSVVLLGVRADFFYENIPVVGGLVSVLWIAGITNAFNLLDNMHGLSAGVAVIALGLFAAVMVITGQPGLAVVLLILMGVSAGFLLFNFPGGKTFLGDGGAYFIGFWIACLTVSATFYFRDSGMPRLVVCFPLFVMAVPLYDTGSVILLRILRRRSIFQADRNHLSHRLEAMGLSRTEAVMAIWVLTLAVGLPSVLMYFSTEIGSAIATLQAALVLGLVVLLERAGGRRGP